MATFDRNSQSRIARQTRRSEQEQTPFYRPKQRRQKPQPPASIGYHAVILGQFGGSSRFPLRSYRYAKLISEPDTEPVGNVWPPMVPDPNVTPASDTAYWSENGAVHINRSQFVPSGTKVWMTPGGPDGRMTFEVQDSISGITRQNGVFFTDRPNESLNRETEARTQFWRLILPNSLGPGEPAEASKAFSNYESINRTFSPTSQNDVVFNYYRAGLMEGTFFFANWRFDRFIIESVNPFITRLNLPDLEF